MNGLFEEPAKSSPVQDWFIKYFIPLGSMVFAGLALLVGKDRLSASIQLSVEAYLLTGTAFVLWHPAQWAYSLLVADIRRRLVARKYRADIKSVVHEFLEISSGDRSDTLPYLLREASGWGEHSIQTDPQVQHIFTLRNWADSLAKRALAGGSGFAMGASEFSNVLADYNRGFVLRQRELANIITRPQFPEVRSRQLKQDWNLRRERHVALTERWGKLSKRINSEFGGIVCGDYFEQLPSLN